MYRFVFTWRWVRLHVLIWLILIPAFIFLGRWQESRFHERSAENAVLSAGIHGTPVPLDTVDAVGALVPEAERWHQVTVSGTYDTSHQYLVRNRQQGGNPGFYVITPLVTADGTAVLVNRGWIPTSTTDVQASPPVPAPPAGPVSVLARLQMTETKGTTGIRDITVGLPAGQISLINTAALAQGTGLQLHGGYVELISSTPSDSPALTPLGEPSLDEGPYLAYWFQWWLFAAIAIGAWWMIIRREAQHRAADAAAELEDEEASYEEDEEELDDLDEADEREDSEEEEEDKTAGDPAGKNEKQVTEPAL